MAAADFSSEVLVIGAGPAGCTAALYAARAGLKTVLSSPTELAGMMAQAARVANFPGQVEAVPGRDILARIRAQALAAGAEPVLESMVGVDFSNPHRLVVYGGERVHTVRAVIIATGAMGRAAKLPGEAELTGRGVALCAACDGPFFKGEDVIVVGQDEQAAEETLTLAQIARSVTLTMPGNKLPLDEETQHVLAQHENVTVRAGLKLERIVGEEAVTGAAFTTPDGGEEQLPAAGVFLYLKGSAPATEFLQGAVAGDADGFLLTDDMGQTNVPGVFAAGDVRSKQVRQMVVAAAEGAVAALGAERYIRKSAKVRPDRG
jgi:thioredoxin reductase (NADPH)